MTRFPALCLWFGLCGSPTHFAAADLHHAFAGESATEKQLWCRLFSCTPDIFSVVQKVKRQGEVEYYEFSPRGGVGQGINARGAAALVMYFRPGVRAADQPKRIAYDEVWVEKQYADMDHNNKLSKADKIAGVTYIYWNSDRFALYLTYGAANLLNVPFSLIDRTQKPSPLERFTYRSLNNVGFVRDMRDWNEIQRVLDKGEWCVLDNIGDRRWFEAAIAQLK